MALCTYQSQYTTNMPLTHEVGQQEVVLPDLADNPTYLQAEEEYGVLGPHDTNNLIEQEHEKQPPEIQQGTQVWCQGHRQRAGRCSLPDNPRS